MICATQSARSVSARYFALIRRFPLRPIKNEKEHKLALVVLNDLVARSASLQPDEVDYRRVLAHLIHQYEAPRRVKPRVTDGEMLEFFIEQHGVTQKEVARATGIAESTISQILSGKRNIPRFKIGPLAKYFHTSPEVFRFEM